MTDPTENILSIIKSLASETNKLDDEELARLSKYLTDKDTANLINIEKHLVSFPNNNARLLYLRVLLEEPRSSMFL